MFNGDLTVEIGGRFQAAAGGRGHSTREASISITGTPYTTPSFFSQPS